MDSNSKMAGAGGSQLIDAAGTYAITGETPTLIENVVALKIVTGVNDGITAMALKPQGTAYNLATVNNIVGADLSTISGEMLTFEHPISSITVAAGMVIIAYAG